MVSPDYNILEIASMNNLYNSIQRLYLQVRIDWAVGDL